MSRSRVAALVLAALVATVLPAGPSAASSTASAVLCTASTSAQVQSCIKQGYSDFGYDANKKNMYWNMFSGANCTNYAAYRLITTQGVTSKRPWTGSGNASNWGRALSGYVTQTPVPGAIAWWPNQGSAGHVAYVERVGAKSIVISESSWGGPVLRWRRIARTDSGRWPDGFLVLSLPAMDQPTVDGTPKVSEKLAASDVALDPRVGADKVSYAWQLDGKPIDGATKETYAPTSSQIGKKLRVVVTVKRGKLASRTLSSPATVVMPGELVSSRAPAVSGFAAPDSTVSATVGAWNLTSKDGVSYAYEWYADGKRLPGLSGARITVPGEAAGKRLTVKVKASAPGYTARTGSASAAKTVAWGTLTTTTDAAVRGTARVGQRLAADAAFSRADVKRRYQWLADGEPIPGATARTFVPGPAQHGKRISVTVVALRTGYREARTTSDVTGPIAPAPMALTAPQVRGTVAVGRDLAVTTPAWAPGASYAYRWFADGRPVSRATGTRLTLTPQLLGKRIHVEVSATAPGYVDASRSSARTGKVARGTISASVSVTGTATVRSILRSKVTVQRPATGTTVRYQWLRDGKPIAGATKTNYRLTSADVRKRVSVRVTLTAGGYDRRELTSKRTGAVR